MRKQRTYPALPGRDGLGPAPITAGQLRPVGRSGGLLTPAEAGGDNAHITMADIVSGMPRPPSYVSPYAEDIPPEAYNLQHYFGGSGIVPDIDVQSEPGSSPMSRWNSAYRQAQNTPPPTPYDERLAELDAQQSRNRYLLDNPLAPPQHTYTDYTPPAFPQRQQVAFPDRPRPQADPWSLLGATLGGLVDPQHAGQFGATPLRGAMDYADQVFADRKERFRAAVEQGQQQYEQQLAQHNEQNRIGQMNQQGRNQAQTANEQQRYQMDVARQGLQANEAGLSGLPSAMRAQREQYLSAQKAQSDLSLAQMDMQTLAARNQLSEQRYQKQLDTYVKMMSVVQKELDSARKSGDRKAALGAQYRLQQLREAGENLRTLFNGQTQRDVAGIHQQGAMARQQQQQQYEQQNPDLLKDAGYITRRDYINEQHKRYNQRMGELAKAGASAADIEKDPYIRGFKSSIEEAQGDLDTYVRTKGGQGSRTQPESGELYYDTRSQTWKKR